MVLLAAVAVAAVAVAGNDFVESLAVLNGVMTSVNLSSIKVKVPGRLKPTPQSFP